MAPLLDYRSEARRVSEPINLFRFLEHLAIAQGRKIIPAQRASVAMFIALDGKATTGADCRVDAGRIAAEIGLSERQVWRHVAALVEQKWLTQTVKANRRSRGKSGVRAAYRLTEPRLDLSDGSGANRVTRAAEQMSDGSAADRVTSQRGNM